MRMLDLSVQSEANIVFACPLTLVARHSVQYRFATSSQHVEAKRKISPPLPMRCEKRLAGSRQGGKKAGTDLGKSGAPIIALA